MRAHRLVQAEYIRISAISKVRLRLMIRSPPGILQNTGSSPFQRPPSFSTRKCSSAKVTGTFSWLYTVAATVT